MSIKPQQEKATICKPCVLWYSSDVDHAVANFSALSMVINSNGYAFGMRFGFSERTVRTTADLDLGSEVIDTCPLTMVQEKESTKIWPPPD